MKFQLGIFLLFSVMILSCHSAEKEKSKTYWIRSGLVTKCDSIKEIRFMCTQQVGYSFIYDDNIYSGVYEFEMKHMLFDLSRFRLGDSLKIAFNKDNPSDNYLHKRKFRNRQYYTKVR